MASVLTYLHTDWIIYAEKVIGFPFTEHHLLMKQLWVQHAAAPKQENLVSVIAHRFQVVVHRF